ncbi:hypothetical protein ABD91_20875 [Lysinibacillus sphaericus]|uniref:hypothetical protein n=1 Tax=Lysinibacillus sphaericus TaxID=1421 RepID=UPI0018CFDBCD|nr:hypothetical protein [Lysinibacillus sphaericus]MBG9693197.1 hypothetical protein [Lysinibacillus sphaericus]
MKILSFKQLLSSVNESSEPLKLIAIATREHELVPGQLHYRVGMSYELERLINGYVLFEVSENERKACFAFLNSQMYTDEQKQAFSYDMGNQFALPHENERAICELVLNEAIVYDNEIDKWTVLLSTGRVKELSNFTQSSGVRRIILDARLGSLKEITDIFPEYELKKRGRKHIKTYWKASVATLHVDIDTAGYGFYNA